MPGVRVRLRPEVEARTGGAVAGALITIRDHGRPARKPDMLDDCVLCVESGQPVTKHYVKTYHVRLDSEGAAIVSEGVWDAWQQMDPSFGPCPFVVENPVEKPPAQRLLLPTAVARLSPGEM